MSKISMAVHGGAGRLEAIHANNKMAGLQESLDAGWKVLEAGNPAEEAVAASLRVMEGIEFFNAGFGGYPNTKGIVLLDVGLMTGERKFCSLVNLRKIKYPSAVALDFIRKKNSIFSIWTHELMLSVENGPDDVKENYGLVASHQDMLAPYVKYLIEKNHIELEAEKTSGTVGAIALDSKGRLAAGTSTGGIRGKSNGRVGDSPIVGAGVFADNEICALSTSGHGEAILASLLTPSIITAIARKQDAEDINKIILDEIQNFSKRYPDSTAGIILLRPDGQVYFKHVGPGFGIGYRCSENKVIKKEFVGSLSNS